MKNIIFTSFFLISIYAISEVNIPILFEWTESNTEEVYTQFDKKNKETLLSLENEPGFEELRLEIAEHIDKNREESKKEDVSYTSKWAYNFYKDDVNPQGVYRRVDKKTYQKHLKEKTLDQVKWVNVVDLDAFIASKVFPKEVTNPSGGSWSCHRDEETKEYRKCLIGFAQSGGDRNVYYEFDFLKLTWVTEESFNYEFLGRTSFSWVDDNNLLVNFDELTYHNINNPDDQISYEDAISRGMISSYGYPNKVLTWKRGESFNPNDVIFKARPEVGYSGGSRLGINGKNADEAFLFYEYISRSNYSFSLKWKKNDGTYTQKKLDFPPDRVSAGVVGKKKGLRAIFKLNNDWKSFKKNDVVSVDVNLVDGEIVESVPKFVFSTRDEAVLIDSISLIDNKKFDETDDQIVLSLSKDVSDSALILDQKNKSWKSRVLKDPLGLKYKSMRVWKDDEDESLHMRISSFLSASKEYIITSDEGVFKYELIDESRSVFDESKYRVEQLWVERGLDQNGVDTKVPYYIVYNPKIVSLENNSVPAPTLIYAYGGFQVSLGPSYLGGRGKRFLDKGGVYVLANIRGGGEFGPYWHSSALKKNRVNTYGDFFAVSEDLIRRGITSSEKLAIKGGSNGGLLTGVAITQRPDLYKAAIVGVPLLDMMRFHKLYVGSSWMTEYGDPEGDEKEFWLEYSPLHKLSAGVTYPKAFIKTNRYDDRVHPAHARKFSLRMDELGVEHYFYENPAGGHGGVSQTSYEQALSSTLEYIYLYKELGM